MTTISGQFPLGDSTIPLPLLLNIVHGYNNAYINEIAVCRSGGVIMHLSLVFLCFLDLAALSDTSPDNQQVHVMAAIITTTPYHPPKSRFQRVAPKPDHQPCVADEGAVIVSAHRQVYDQS